MAVYSASAGIKHIQENGIRPFDIGKDLRPVAELIADAFAHELDQRGASALRNTRDEPLQQRDQGAQSQHG